MKLFEILDNPYEYEIKDAGSVGGDKVATFKDDSGETVTVQIEYWGGPELYNVDFKRKGSYEMTNDSSNEKHQAIRIMATVVAILKDFVQDVKSSKRPAKFIAFSSKKTEGSRSSLYDRMVKRIAPAIGFAIVTDHKNIDHPILPSWWNQKLQMAKSHDYTLLVDTALVQNKK